MWANSQEFSFGMHYKEWKDMALGAVSAHPLARGVSSLTQAALYMRHRMAQDSKDHQNL